MSGNSPFSKFTFPSGLTINNRLVKASMEENMSGEGLLPSPDLIHLYRQWAQGGAGLLLTGNVMVDHAAMTGPGGVALEKDTPLGPFVEWAEAAQQDGCKVWMQLNHPGRQVYANMQGKVLAPSAIALKMGKLSKLFGQPSAMTEIEIEDVITRFGDTAQQAQAAGFDGVEIHAAHGYLLAQFLSPLANQRTDQWGGNIANRARLLLAVVTEVKRRTRDDFGIGVKLNSADFQRGGFAEDDALAVVKVLESSGVDMVELSGGSYEAPAMQGMTADGRTLAREAYFLEFASMIAAQTTLPIMTTGGIRRLPVAEQVLTNGVELVGLATALAMTPDLPKKWQADPDFVAPTPVILWRNKTLQALATMAMIKRNLQRIGKGKDPLASMSGWWSLLCDQRRKGKLTKRYVRYLGSVGK